MALRELRFSSSKTEDRRKLHLQASLLESERTKKNNTVENTPGFQDPQAAEDAEDEEVVADVVEEVSVGMDKLGTLVEPRLRRTDASMLECWRYFMDL